MTAILYQSEGLIWGAAKSENPEPMNGLLSRSISGDRIEIDTFYAAGYVLTVIGMVGTFSGETMSGSYFQIDRLGDLTFSSFAGMGASFDPAGYADLAAPVAAASTEIPQSSETEVEPEAKTVDETAGRYTDVHQLSAGINPRILGYTTPVTEKSRIV